MQKYKFLMLLIAAFLLAGINTSAKALDLFPSASKKNVDIIPAHNASGSDYNYNRGHNTHPPMRMTPDRSELVRLDEDAAAIIVGNPAHISVMADNSRTLVLVPRESGASHFTVLDADQNVIMQRHVIIGVGVKDYVRIRRTCGGDESCRETSTFYCPGTCHEIAPIGSEKTPSSNKGSNDLAKASTSSLAELLPQDSLNETPAAR